MRRWGWFLLYVAVMVSLPFWLGCADLAPRDARIILLELRGCLREDAGICKEMGPALDKPPQDGSLFYLKAHAPGALLMEQGWGYPNRGTDAGAVTDWYPPVMADTLSGWWRITHREYQWLTWHVRLPWGQGNILHADSLRWDW